MDRKKAEPKLAKTNVFAMRAVIVLLGFIVSAVLARSAGGFSQTSTGNPKPNKIALLVGINHYKYSDRISPLEGSVNDVEDMKQVLVGKFEFLPENIVTLKDSEATHDGIMGAIKSHLIAKAQPGDIVVFQFSGHGSQMKDVTGKRISKLDETIVPYDSRDPDGKVFDISGAELHNSLVQLASRTKNLTFILDSCHSGTLVRGALVRAIPADTRDVPPPVAQTLRGFVSSEAEVTPKFAFISAATSKENAYEHFEAGRSSGALTHFLTQQLRSSGAGATYRDVMDSVLANVTANYPAQHPSLEGIEADQRIFGDITSVAGSYVVASPSQLSPKRVTLSIGLVEGATVGSIYDIYPPGSRRFAPPEQASARVQLASVDAFSSEAQIVSGSKVQQASRAVERSHRYGSARLRIYLDGLEQSAALQSVADELAKLNYVEVVEQASHCNVQLRAAAHMIQTLAADGTTLSTPVPEDEQARLLGQIKQWAKWFKVLSIQHAQPAIPVSLSIAGSATRDPMANIGRPDMGVFAGETVTVRLTNSSERDLYVAMLDLSSDGSIQVVYPGVSGSKEVLKEQATFERTLSASLPRGRSLVTDILKVFVSYKPIDLTPLTQDTIRSLGSDHDDNDPLQALLEESAGLSRSLTPVLDKPADLATWTTVQRSIRVRRRG